MHNPSGNRGRIDPPARVSDVLSHQPPGGSGAGTAVAGGSDPVNPGEDLRCTVPEPLASLVPDLPGLVFICDGNGRLTGLNRRGEMLLGSPSSDLAGTRVLELVAEEDRPSLLRLLRELPDKGPFEAIVHLVGGSGGRIPCFLSASRLAIGGMSLTVLLGSPVPGGHEIDEALRESEQRFREFSELLPQAVYETDEQGVLTFANRPSIECFGYTPEDFLQPFPIFRVISPEEREKAIQNFQGTLRGERNVPAEYTAIKKDGTRFTMMTYASRILRNGKPVGLRGLALDITERKRMEEALQAANRKIMLLNSITRHDILNTVTALMGYTALVKESSEPAEIASLLGKIEKTTYRIRQQIEFTRDYQELGVQGPQWQSAQEVATASTAPLRSPDVAVEIHLEGLSLSADMLLGKVFYNLMDNSLRHAGSGLSLITLTWREHPAGAVVIYSDNGTGVAEDQKERIFAYGVGKGTGLGLFLTREILSLTGIAIRENGEYGKGARFEISIPSACSRSSVPAR
ncbi:MAG: PAS domain-containing sensor histidine kinase [Methanomicrobiales archaeon]|nr:PAS domain-containing sensor histidine kinase [Methanomicrobiales archaeon]